MAIEKAQPHVARLVVDARLAGHSGIGTYIAEVLPRVLPGLAEWRPLVLAARGKRDAIVALSGAGAEVRVWSVAPLSARDLWAAPPGIGPDDLVWTPHFNVPLRSRCALAVTLHDVLPLTSPALAGRGRSAAVHTWLRAIRRRARAVLCVSEFTQSEVVRLGGVASDRIIVTPLGADRAWFEAGAGNMQPVPAPAVPTIIFVGLMKPHKNVLRLLRAFIRVRDRIPHRLVLVAKHRNLRNVDRAALALATSMPDRVELVEDLPFPDLVKRVSQAQFAVQPSLHEGFGLPALEAMAAGVPVLASNAGALPEVCGEAAVYCDPRSEDEIARCLLLLASDEALRKRLSAAGRLRAQGFTWEACAHITQNALRDALQFHSAMRVNG